MKTNQFSVNGIVANMMNSHKLNPESYSRKQRKLISDSYYSPIKQNPRVLKHDKRGNS